MKEYLEMANLDIAEVLVGMVGTLFFGLLVVLCAMLQY